MIADIFKSTWSLFLGMIFLMLGSGLQGTLVSWRANFEGFTSSTTGWIMTAYYVGFLAGSLLATKLIRQVGHVRLFAALASLASAAFLAQILFITPESWVLMRLLTGFCFAGIFVIVESWLNERSENETRGQVLSIYLFISYGGLAGGQWLFNLSDPSSYQLFLLSSILLSFALVPVLLTSTVTPEIVESETMNPRKLFRRAPAGVVSVVLSSISQGVLFGMAPVYAANVGMSIPQTALFMSMFIAFGAIAHIPLGWLSDRSDRRMVILGACSIALLLCYVLLKTNTGGTGFVILFGLLGGMILPIYSLGAAHINDRLKPEQMTSASGTILLLYGVGAAIGPITVGYMIKLLGDDGFLFYLGGISLLNALLVMYWIKQREAVPEEDQIDYQLSARPTIIAMDLVAQEAQEIQELEESSKESENIEKTESK